MSVSVFDIASYILNKCGKMTAVKLQKLVYYCQAWSLVWDEEPLFHEKIEAWANGPVVRELYNKHRGSFEVSPVSYGDTLCLSEKQKETVDSVLEYYGNKSSQWLSDLTHKEDPWKNARKGLTPSTRGSRAITHASMMEYYSSL
ncbi:phage-associated protein [Candidatus Magnetobacterium bavaricum]|uniref:Phage-associated protein n=1 Tax=Candidatus Magnetobacterium bavaricum TaxID=29290 RepID=A0A0F3GXE9_9BACT|nr:phage-associated protein [Candidatus Magnetobacterium bavaricum]